MGWLKAKDNSQRPTNLPVPHSLLWVSQDRKPPRSGGGHDLQICFYLTEPAGITLLFIIGVSQFGQPSGALSGTSSGVNHNGS